MRYERRTATEGVELRDAGDTLTAVGYAAVFGQRADIGGFTEQIAPTAFNKTVKEADVRALFNHSADYPLGRVGAGTLRLSVDDHGLRYEVDLPSSPVGATVAEALRRGDVAGSSFGFRVVGRGDTWDELDDGTPLRTLTEVALRDVGPVTFPAYEGTDSAIRSLAEARSLDIEALIEAHHDGRLADLLRDPDPDEHEPAAVAAPVRRRRPRRG